VSRISPQSYSNKARGQRRRQSAAAEIPAAASCPDAGQDDDFRPVLFYFALAKKKQTTINFSVRSIADWTVNRIKS
jgi:hypothetical protein